MDCCDNQNKNMKGGKMDYKKAALWGVIGILLLAVVYVTFFQGSASTSDIAGQTAQASQYAGMVGGC